MILEVFQNGSDKVNCSTFCLGLIATCISAIIPALECCQRFAIWTRVAWMPFESKPFPKPSAN